MIHQNRRKELLSQLDDDSIVIVSTNPEQRRSGNVHYPFRPHSDFYYLTGFDEPEALAVITSSSYTILLRPRDKKREIWNGERLGVDNAPEALNADKSYTIDLLKNKLPKLMKGYKSIYFDPKPYSIDDEIIKILVLANKKYKSIEPILHEMRLIKGSDEISIMQKAADISAEAHKIAMQKVRPGMFEYELQSVFDGYFKQHNSEHAYTPIVAGGKNACVLHYIKNNKVLKDNELVLVDAGCEVEYYASDITRTFPINGKFSKAQKQIYQLVLDAQIAAINNIKPGAKINKPHKAATDIIKQGLIDLGILQAEGELSQFYMHGTGHWIGLDVHDVGKYKDNDKHREFTPGMITTVEPGIYIRSDDKIDPIYHNIGVRIEDDVLVTEDGNTVLTRSLVKEIKDIESIMQLQE